MRSYRSLLSHLNHRIKPSDTIVEPDEYIEQTSVFLAVPTGPTKHVLAVEFIGYNQAVLKHNLSVNVSETTQVMRYGILTEGGQHKACRLMLHDNSFAPPKRRLWFDDRPYNDGRHAS